jgi:glyoxylase-like metal-dependent hydrolase (beta-lactamase superfamily II)
MIGIGTADSKRTDWFVKIGNYDLYSLMAGRFGLDGGAMFGVVPKVMWSEVHPADLSNRIEMVSRSLLIVGEGKVILVDTGIGQNWSEKERSIYAIDRSVDINTSLAERGFDPADVTHVIQTHLHFDHSGASTGIHGSIRLPAFPNAEYYIQQGHYQWACNPSLRDRVSFRAEHWECIVATGRMHWLEGEVELFPGIFLEILHGHTPYQQIPRISDGCTTLLFCGDLIPLASHVRLPWVMGYDLKPIDSMREKEDILIRSAEHDWFLFLQHDPRYELCRVSADTEGFTVSEPLSLR